MSERKYGEVIFFCKKGYGFISWSNANIKQKDMFVHYSDISCEGFKMLHKGQMVTFNIGTNNNGDPKAVDVQVLKN